MISGTLQGLGVGPGDPELLTLKAVRLLRAAPVLAYVTSLDGESQARTIVAAHLPGGQIEEPIPLACSPDPAPAQAAYDAAADRLAVHLAAGRDVVLLCEGDPLFYGSFQYMATRLGERFPVTVVPGVVSFTAAAAAALWPLSGRNDIMTILPAPLPEATLRARLQETDCAVILKIGRHGAKLRRVLDALDLTRKALVIEYASRPQQRIVPLADVDAATLPYFSLILLRRTDGDNTDTSAASPLS